MIKQEQIKPSSRNGTKEPLLLEDTGIKKFEIKFNGASVLGKRPGTVALRRLQLAPLFCSVQTCRKRLPQPNDQPIALRFRYGSKSCAVLCSSTWRAKLIDELNFNPDVYPFELKRHGVSAFFHLMKKFGSKRKSLNRVVFINAHTPKKQETKSMSIFPVRAAMGYLWHRAQRC